MLSLFSNKPLLEEDSIHWMFDTYAWALDQFDAEYFYRHSVLVLPTNEFFPGRADSHAGMAELIFRQVANYTGIGHWPVKVVAEQACQISRNTQFAIEGPLRQKNASTDLQTASEHWLEIPYNSNQVSNPEGMIASFAHIIAFYLGQLANKPPPGGAEYWPHTTELLAIFNGFGLMFANSAYTFKGGCGSCYNPLADRDAYLTERQSTYALAIFTVLKNIPLKQVQKHLKGHLRGFYARSVKDVSKRLQAMGNARLLAARQ
ncbi:MAG: hypothetical protein QNJ69_12920 [Gammaproteobacteria bacterium]|nr:hypothetical protein [Gammaproteobacteria bacterium]